MFFSLMGCFLAAFVCQRCGIVSLVLSRLSRKREPLMNLAQQEESNKGCWATPGPRIGTGAWVISYRAALKE